MKINDIVKEVHQISKDKGWHDRPRELPEILMLAVSELAEALEEYRNNMPESYEKDGKPEGAAIEMADCIIRIMDAFGKYGWDLEAAMRKKIEFNRTRPYRHGNKKC